MNQNFPQEPGERPALASHAAALDESGHAGAAPASEPAPDAPQPHAAAAQPGHGLAYAVIVVFLLAVAFGLWGVWRSLMPQPGNAQEQLNAQAHEMESLRQRVATLTQSDQVSRAANAELQGTLAERDEEIAGLRADVAFYERFVGATGQRRGLSVHALELTSQDAQVWKFTATLTQNIHRDVNQGKVTLSVEGSHNGRMQHLDWDTLRQQAQAPAADYSFKYFQRVEGDLLLPPGFKPVRVTVRLDPAAGKPVQQSFAWTEAARGNGA